MIIGRNFAEKLYSENQEEKLYSTGDEELDNLLEKAFCEGYELGQKEFGNPINKAAKRSFEINQGLTSYKEAYNNASNNVLNLLNRHKPKTTNAAEIAAIAVTRQHQRYAGNPNSLDAKINYKGFLGNLGKNNHTYKREFKPAVKYPYKNFGNFDPKNN